MSLEVLDMCCGPRSMWFCPDDFRVVMGDKRMETLTVKDRTHGKEDGVRIIDIAPDVVHDFRNLPYARGTFRLVVFDPPHLNRAGPNSWMAAKYGKLGPDWAVDLRRGFEEGFRVLRTNGVLIFKWNEAQIKLKQVLACTNESPLFGQKSGRNGLTHWLVFMKLAA